MPLTNIILAKEAGQTFQPLLLCELYFNDGSVLRMSTHDFRAATSGVQWNGFDYLPRIMNSDMTAMQALSSLGADVVPYITLKLADADRTLWDNYEKTKGFKGAKVIFRFVFYDVVAKTFSSDSLVKFVGICESPSNDDEFLTVRCINKMNMAKVSLPYAMFQRNCFKVYPDTSDLVDANGNYLSDACAAEAARRFQAAADVKSNPCWNCGYSPTASGGNARGNLAPNGKPYPACDLSQAACLARMGSGSDITKDSQGRNTARFGGITWQVPTQWSGTPFGSSKSSKYNPNWDNTPVYNQYLPMVYGTAMVYPVVINVVGDANSTRGEAVLSLGQLLAIYTVNVNDHDLPQVIGTTIPPGVDPLHRFNIINLGDRSGALLTDADFSDPDPHGGMALIEWVIFSAEGSSSAPPTIRSVVAGNAIPAFQAFSSISTAGHVSVSNNVLFGEGVQVTILGTGTSLDGATFQTLNNSGTGFDLVGFDAAAYPDYHTQTGYFGGAAIDSAQSLGSTATGLANQDNSNITEQFISGVGANPIWTMLDVMIRAGWDYTDMDIPSWIAAAAVCDRQITRQDGTTGPLFSTSLVLKDPKSVSDIVRGLRLACRATLAPSRDDASLLGVQIDGTLADQQPNPIPESNYQSPVQSIDHTGAVKSGYIAYSFDNSNILRRNGKSTLQVNQQPINNSFNSVNFAFMDCQNSYVTDTVTVRDSQDINNIGQEVSYSLPILGVNTYDQAQRCGAFFIASKLQGNPRGDSGGTWAVKFETSFRALHLRIGDLIWVTSTRDGFTNQLFRVSSITPSTDWESMTIEATWHEDFWHTDSFGQAGWTLQPNVASSLSRPPLPWSPAQAVPKNANDPLGQDLTFDLSQNYVNQNGTIQPQIVIDGKNPPTSSSATVVPALFDMVPTVTPGGGTIPGGSNYAIAICTQDENGLWSAPSNGANVQIASGQNYYSIELTGLNWQKKIVAGSPVTPTKYGVWMGPDNNHMTLQGDPLSDFPATVTLTSYTTTGIGLPDTEFDHFNAKLFTARHTGSLGAQVTAATSTTIQSAGANWAADAFKNRVVSIIADYEAGLVPVKNYKITGNSADTLTVDGNPYGDGVIKGDVFVIRLGVTTATANSVQDAVLNAAPNDQNGHGFADNAEAGKLLWIWKGTGKGQIFPILSNTADTVVINGTFSVRPDSTSVWLITEPTVYDAQDSPSMPMTMNVANESGSTIVVRVDTVESTGQECVPNLSPIRDIYIYGAQDTRTITYADAQSVNGVMTVMQRSTDKRVLADTSGGSYFYQLLPDATVSNQPLLVEKTSSDGNILTVKSDPNDAFSDSTTSIVLSAKADSVLLNF